MFENCRSGDQSENVVLDESKVIVDTSTLTIARASTDHVVTAHTSVGDLTAYCCDNGLPKASVVKEAVPADLDKIGDNNAVISCDLNVISADVHCEVVMGDDGECDEDVFDCEFEDCPDVNEVSDVYSESATGNTLATVPKGKGKKKSNRSKVQKVQKIKSKSVSLKLSQANVALLSESVMKGTRSKSSRKIVPIY
ncbi:hypothetical protein SNE40_017493 [Patella caerulea]|uniref:Uncharacterized protein n=1 Tax=Patella caerulea TaxID=87958 RepID=A0AAN8PQ29_PATCE